MRSLRDLQREFARGVLYEDATAISSAIVSRGIDPLRRVNIYRNNAREGFLKTLEAAFPVIVRLAGLDWFRQTGTQYMRAHPSTSGNLHFAGLQFAEFLDAALSDSQYAYFSDVARLEWAYQEVLVAADHPPFEPAALSTIAPDRYGELRFEVHPALRLVASRYPLLAIWQGNRGDAADDVTVDLATGPSRLLVIRREDHVELRELPPREFALLDAFASGESFQEAVDRVVATADDQTLSSAFAHLVQLGTLVDFSIDPVTTRDTTLVS